MFSQDELCTDPNCKLCNVHLVYSKKSFDPLDTPPQTNLQDDMDGYPIGMDSDYTSMPYTEQPGMVTLPGGQTITQESYEKMREPLPTIQELFGIKKRCECGSDTIGVGYHSSWCPKA